MTFYIKLISTIFFAFISVQSFGQIEKGTWMLRGEGSVYAYNSSNNFLPDSSFTSDIFTKINLSASAGYFFYDRVVAGLKLVFTVDLNGKTSVFKDDNQNSLALGPYVRYYFLKNEGHFNILAEADYQRGFNWGKKYALAGGSDYYSLMGGTEIFFNEAAGIEIMLGYKHYSYKNNNPTYFLYKGNYDAFQTSIGLVIHLDGKNK